MLLRATVCLAAILLAPPADAGWRRLDTPNFIVIGDADPRQLRTIAVQFEGFRETLSRVLSPHATSTAVPTVVVVFPTDRAFTPFKHRQQGKVIQSAGYFHGDRDFNYIAILNDRRPGATRVIFHEYAHLVLSNISTTLPAWLSEGLAEYYSTYDIADGGREAIIGSTIPEHVPLLATRALLPLDQLLQVDETSPLYTEGDRRSLFYAQSWALTHMLLRGPRADQLTAFIRHKQEGVGDLEAWRRAFGDAPVEGELRIYLRRVSFAPSRYRFEGTRGPFEGSTVEMAEPDVNAMLAELQVRQRRYEDAEPLVRAALASRPSHAHANVLMAHLEMERGAAAAAADRLMKLGSIDDWFVAYSAGIALAEAIDRSRDPSLERLDAARSYFESARRGREMPNALAHLVLIDLMFPGEPLPESRAAIERARAAVPGRHDYALIHARVLAAIGEADAARGILTGLMAPGFPAHIREAARTWLATGGRKAVRVRGPGEERADGILERIDCPAGAPATFHVRMAGGVRALQAPRLDRVEFITYHRGVTTEMICGASPWKDPMPVAVTWKTGPDGVRVLVAVEFLPARRN